MSGTFVFEALLVARRASHLKRAGRNPHIKLVVLEIPALRSGRRWSLSGGHRGHDQKKNHKRHKTHNVSHSSSFPVLSPRLSMETPALSSSVKRRFVIGVRSGYLMWRPPLSRPEPPPMTRFG